jgi:hypothetical protein
VIGTIDVESERPNAFDKDTEELLEDCAVLLQPLFAGTWHPAILPRSIKELIDGLQLRG